MKYLLTNIKLKLNDLKINADRFIGQIDLPVINFLRKQRKKKEIIKKMQELRDYNIKNNVPAMIHSLQISELRRKLKEL